MLHALCPLRFLLVGKAMPRFYVPEPIIKKGMLTVTGDEVKHIRKVLRLGTGDRISIFDGSGMEYEGAIAEVTPSSVVIKIHDTSPSKKESHLEITLAQSILKSEKMDYLIQKATELGVNALVPFVSSRSVPLLEESKKVERTLRWEKIAIEASKQCGRSIPPKIGPFQGYAEMLQSLSKDHLRLILWEREGERMKEVLRRFSGQRRITFIVGPEGGFSVEEVEQAKREGFIPLSLGNRILRAETASLCLLSILQYEMGDIG